MVQQDYILRQIQTLAQVLAQVLFRKRSDQPEEAQDVLAEGLERALGMDLPTLRHLPRDEVLALCAPGGPLAGDASVAVAALLSEDSSSDGRRRALWVYDWALASGQAVPFDVHARIASLRASLQPPLPT